MKKAANLVDKALEVARNVRNIPKKPVKTKGKRTVPEALDWGPGIPLDKLAYLNDEEMALIQAKRMFKDKRNYHGVPAFPDPGDTGAGEKPAGSGEGATTGGGSDSGGGSGSAGGSTGGGSDSGAGSSAGAGTGGGSDSGSNNASSSGTTSTESKGPSAGPTSQPARSEPSSYSGQSSAPSPTAPTGYQSYGGYDPTSNAPSTMASESTLDRIASGSSVIGNTSPQGYSVPKIQDRVPTVNFAQSPTMASPTGTEDIYEGANSPFADPAVQSYNADNPSLAGAVSQYSQYRSPPADTTSAFTNAQNRMYAAQDAANFGETGALPRGGGYMRVQDPTPTSYNPVASQYAPSDMAGTTRAYGQLSGPNQGLGYNPASPSVVAANAPAATSQTPTVSLSNLANPNEQQAANYSFAQNNRWNGLSGYGSLNTPQETAMAQPNQAYPQATSNPEMARIVAGDPSLRATGTLPEGYAQTGRVLNVADMGYPTAPLSESTPPSQVASGYSPATPAAPPVTTNVFYSSPAQQAADIRRAVALSQGPATPPSVAPAGAEGVQPTETDEEYNYDPAKDPANYVRPISPGEENQPGYLSSEQRTAYQDGLGGTRSSERAPPAGVTVERKPDETEKVKKKKKKEPPRKEKPYKYRNYTYTNYEPITTKPDDDITAFNQYNQENFKKGGSVNDSVQSALRIAKSKLL